MHLCRLVFAIVLLSSASRAFASTGDNAYVFFDQQNQPTSISDTKGRKSYVYFWATWCAPCIVTLTKLAENFTSEELENLLVVSLDDDQEKAKLIMSVMEFPGEHWTAKTGSAVYKERAFLFKRNSLPHLISLDSEGQADSTMYTPRDKEEWLDLLSED